MTMTEHDIGDIVRLSAAFSDSDGVAFDPTTVSVAYIEPGAATQTLVYGTDPAVIKDSSGHYHVDINIGTSGTWRYRWFSIGTGQAAEEGTFYVRAQTVI